ncbi:MAG TPA: hypothetical protein VMU81_15040 [Acetobacteraceae bacterium]|nr:hypothetical protein [Acetobacteraceae bacterium]
MSDKQWRFGELLREVFDEMQQPVEFAAGEIHAHAAKVQQLLAQARLELDAEDRAAAAQAGVTDDDVIAFFTAGTPFTHAQQRLLFSDPGVRERFRERQQQYAITLPQPGGGQATAPSPRIAEMPALIAAATDQGANFQRPFAGGMLTINPVGIGDQVYVVFSFEDPTIVSRVLIVKRTRDERIERLQLPPPDDGEIVLIKDLAVPADKDLVELLRDPHSSAVFLR